MVAMFQLVAVLERRVGATGGRADKLPRAILSKAFSGELVPTEAALARAEGREYESASVLLARLAKSAVADTSKMRRGKSGGITPSRLAAED